jgi:hypothetical protein
MPRPVLLNNIDHRDLRIDTRRSAALGDAVMLAPTFPGEFRSVQAHYPIMFRKGADGRFQPVALFGLRDGQNLFLQAADDGEERWDAHYLPLAIERQPFMIGRDADGEPVIHVDLDSPRVGDRGEPVFLEHGGTTAYIERISSVLHALQQGIEDVPDFVDALLEHDLLESFALDVELADGGQHRLSGFYTVHEERLSSLQAEPLARLHHAGYLGPVYMAIASLSQFRALIERMQRATDRDAQ